MTTINKVTGFEQIPDKKHLLQAFSKIFGKVKNLRIFNEFHSSRNSEIIAEVVFFSKKSTSKALSMRSFYYNRGRLTFTSGQDSVEDLYHQQSWEQKPFQKNKKNRKGTKKGGKKKRKKSGTQKSVSEPEKLNLVHASNLPISYGKATLEKWLVHDLNIKQIHKLIKKNSHQKKLGIGRSAIIELHADDPRTVEDLNALEPTILGSPIQFEAYKPRETIRPAGQSSGLQNGPGLHQQDECELSKQDALNRLLLKSLNLIDSEKNQLNWLRPVRSSFFKLNKPWNRYSHDDSNLRLNLDH